MTGRSSISLTTTRLASSMSLAPSCVSIRLEEVSTAEMPFGYGIAKVAKHGMLTTGPDRSFKCPTFLWLDPKKAFVLVGWWTGVVELLFFPTFGRQCLDA